ncbi:MAG TPA: DUF4388 domain-containing protein [Thermoanaerobaculia bacterium]|nr:DUF4388 domain-containing protein [Thermoanaerobaculia bacterium]
MGLEGTLRDFSVTDLVQMLGLQRKTGMLSVEGAEDRILVSFEAGQIVSADSEASSLDERVGNLLVRSGRLAPAELLRALEDRKTTQSSLGSLLLRDRYVSVEDLREAFRLQIHRIVLPACRWKEGKFRFNPGAVATNDGPLLALPVDAVLMESVQVLDEWPRLEQKVPSRDLVMHRAPGVENLHLVVQADQAGEGSLLVSRREAETWKWVDGRRRVSDILERAFLSDLEVYLALADLLDRNLIMAEYAQPGAGAPRAAREPAVSARAAGLWLIVLLLGASALLEVPRSSWNVLWRPRGERRETSRFLGSVSLARLASIERAVRVYYDATGQYPRSLEDLLNVRVLDPRVSSDPYGNPYRYILRSEDGKFSLYGRNARGGIDLDLSLERSLAPVSESGTASKSKPVERKPGVEIIQ